MQVNSNRPIIGDFFNILLSPKRFFVSRFKELSDRRMFGLGYLGMVIGLGLGGLVMVFFSKAVNKDFLLNKDLYMPVIKNLGLSEQEFLDLVLAQQAYSLLLAVLSPIIAYMAPHIFGGVVFVFLWLLMRPTYDKINFHRVMECTAMALTSMAFYAIPAIGPAIAVVMVSINLSRALFQEYAMVGFMKVIGILSAVYISFSLASGTLQVLAKSLTGLLSR